MRTITFISLLLPVSLFASGNENGPQMPHGMDSVFSKLPDPVAIVRGKKFSKGQFQELLHRKLGQHYLRANRDRMLVVLEEHLRDKFVQEETERQKIQVTEKEIEAAFQLERKKAEAENDGRPLAELLKERGLTVELFKNLQVVPNLKTVRMVEKELTDEACRKFFEQNLEQFDLREVHLSHILVTGTGEKSLKKIKDVQALLKPDGSNFADLARKYSNCRSKRRGGDLGFQVRRPDDPVVQAAFGLKKGERVGPIHGRYGYHLVQVHGRRGEPPAYGSFKEQAKSALQEELLQNLMLRLWKEAEVVVKF